MARRLNRRGWFVLVSIASDDGDYCVDFFERPDGGFGFQHFRSDPEDQGGWTPVGGTASVVLDSIGTAVDTAVAAISWLTRHPMARRELSAWRDSQR